MTATICPTRVPAAEILRDLKRVAAQCGGRISQKQYARHGQFSSMPAERAFGSWNAALKAAGLPVIERWPRSPETRLRMSERQRERQRLRPTTVRACLACEHDFESEGPHNRLCTRCRTAIELGHEPRGHVDSAMVVA
jgi:hypothetical protein